MKKKVIIPVLVACADDFPLLNKPNFGRLDFI